MIRNASSTSGGNSTRFDAFHYLVEPNVGDGELIGINFTHPNTSLRIRLFPAGHCNIEIVGCRYIWFTTDHTQNVIDRILIAPAARFAASDLPETVRLRLAAELSSGAGSVVRLFPVVGIDFVSVGDEIVVTNG